MNTSQPTVDLPTLPEPWDYCYEWNGPYGTRKFSVSPYNGLKSDRTVPLFTTEQMRSYALAVVEKDRAERVAQQADEIERLRNGLREVLEIARLWEPDNASGGERRTLVIARQLLPIVSGSA